MTRSDRVAQIIRIEVSDIVRNKLVDPRIGFASITDVELTPDLKFAKIFVSILGNDKQKKETIAGLRCATGFIRTELGKRLELRFVPEILFIKDESIERGSKVMSIINNLSRKVVGNKRGKNDR